MTSKLTNPVTAVDVSDGARAQSPTGTVVLSRFFAKSTVELEDGVRLDAPPKLRTTAKSRPRSSRAVGRREIHVVAPTAEGDINSPEDEIMALINHKDPSTSPITREEVVTTLTPKQRERAESPSLKVPVPLSKPQQFECYLGNCAPLMLYARERYGEPGSGGITTRQVRAWLKANPSYVPEHLRDTDFHVDHIISDGVGGHSWPLNYFLMPKAANLWFGGWLTIEKRRYVGMYAWTAATNFTMWCAQKSRATLPFGTFDPVSDKFLSKRGR